MLHIVGNIQCIVLVCLPLERAALVKYVLKNLAFKFIEKNYICCYLKTICIKAKSLNKNTFINYIVPRHNKMAACVEQAISLQVLCSLNKNNISKVVILYVRTRTTKSSIKNKG